MKLKLYIHKLGGPYIDIDIESFLENSLHSTTMKLS
jgi:hypothetical protein